MKETDLIAELDRINDTAGHSIGEMEPHDSESVATVLLMSLNSKLDLLIRIQINEASNIEKVPKAPAGALEGLALGPE